MLHNYSVQEVSKDAVMVHSPSGKCYSVIKGQGCDCPDKQIRGGSYDGKCKHELHLESVKFWNSDTGFGVMLDAMKRNGFDRPPIKRVAVKPKKQTARRIISHTRDQNANRINKPKKVSEAELSEAREALWA